jgi:hypothetical protein
MSTSLIEFQEAFIKIKERMTPKLNKMKDLAQKGNSLCQKVAHIYDRWMDSKDIGDLQILTSYLDEFDKLEKANKL